MLNEHIIARIIASVNSVYDLDVTKDEVLSVYHYGGAALGCKLGAVQPIEQQLKEYGFR